MSDTPYKKRTVTLTDRPPVTIKDAEWPLLASGDYAKDHHNGTPLPRYEYDEHKILVREHADGRKLVYAILSGATAWTGTSDRREGVLLSPTDDVVEAIRKVGQMCEIDDRAIRECIADLPAEEL